MTQYSDRQGSVRYSDRQSSVRYSDRVALGIVTE